MQGALIAKIAIAVIFLIIWIVRKAATPSKPVTKFQQPPPQNFNNPFQQNPQSNPNQFQHNPSVNQNPFPEAQNPFLPKQPPIPQNPFQQIPQNQNPSITQTDIDNLFDNNKDAFSQASTRNDNSNMGVGAQSFYCMYCGKKFSNVDALGRDTCFKHPKSELGLQKHVLYRGAGRPNVGF